MALGASLAAALVVVAAQPVRSPWWTYADADATYVAAGLNMLVGEPARYLDHPGLPLQQLIAATYGLGELGAWIGGRPTGHEYVDARLLELEGTRPVFRGYAIAFYLAGALLSVLLLARLLGGWGWGLAGGLLWVAAPGLVPMSIQFRPDVLLALLALVFAFLIGRALQTRSALLYGAAAAELGFTLMLKLHAAGLLVPLFVAAVWRPPAPGWWEETKRDATAGLRRNGAWLLVLAVVWLAVAIALNARHLPFTPSWEQLVATLGPVLVVAGFLGLTRLARGTRLQRVLDPFYGFVAGAFVAGLLLPVTLDVPDGMRALVYVANGLVGRGINSDVEPFSASLDPLWDTRLPLFLVLAAIAAAVGLWRRDPQPVVWLSGAVMLTVMAVARPPAAHYFAPAFMLTVPAVLWLLSRRSGPLVAVATAVLVAYAAWPAIEHRHDPAEEAERFERAVSPSLGILDGLLIPGDPALVPSNWPTGDSRYFEWVQNVVAYTPVYPYGYLPATAAAVEEAKEHGRRLRWYTGPEAVGARAGDRLELGTAGVFVVRPVAGAEDVVELLSGPGTGR